MSPWVPEPRPEPLLQESDAYTLGLLPPSTSVCSLGARGYGASVMLRLRGTEGQKLEGVTDEHRDEASDVAAEVQTQGQQGAQGKEIGRAHV